MSPTQTKKCSRCEVEKPLFRFHRNSRCAFGRHSWCKVCVKNYQTSDRTEKQSVGERTPCVYVVINPAWPEWVKVGSATPRKAHYDPCKGRMKSYNTGSPHRDYEIVFKFIHDYAARIEFSAQGSLRNTFEQGAVSSFGERSEWFKCSIKDAVAAIEKCKQKVIEDVDREKQKQIKKNELKEKIRVREKELKNKKRKMKKEEQIRARVREKELKKEEKEEKRKELEKKKELSSLLDIAWSSILNAEDDDFSELSDEIYFVEILTDRACIKQKPVVEILTDRAFIKIDGPTREQEKRSIKQKKEPVYRFGERQAKMKQFFS